MNMLKNCILIFVSTCIAVLVAEYALRFALPEAVPNGPQSTSELVQDEALSHVYTPGGILGGGTEMKQFDANGFINQEVLPTYDIVALGDSHTAGSLHKWPQQLSEISGRTVYNMGVDGYGVGQYYHLMDKALSLHPKTVVVGLYIGNDIFDTYNLTYHWPYWSSYRSPDFADNQPLTVAGLDKIDVRFKGLRDYLHRNSVLYSLLSESTRQMREGLGLATPRYTGTKDWAHAAYEAGLLWDDDPRLKTIFWVGYRMSGVDVDDKNIREGVRLTSVFLPEMKKKADAVGAHLLIAILPTKERSYYTLVKEKADESTLYQRAVLAEDKLRFQIFDICAKNSITCVDILPTMEAALLGGRDIYQKNQNDHPSSSGYDAYAEGIFEGLKKFDF